MILIKLRTFVSEQKDIENKVGQNYDSFCIAKLGKIFRYTSFVEQNLAERYTINGYDAHPLNRFIPTDKEGNVLDKPKNYFEWLNNTCNTLYDKDLSKYEQYQEALDRVLFKGFTLAEFQEYNGKWSFYGSGNVIDIPKKGTIEDLCELGLELTEAAINELTK